MTTNTEDTNRYGRITNREKDIIRERARSGIPVDEIAKEIERSVKCVEDNLARLGIRLETKKERADYAEFDIRNSVYWSRLRAQFSEKELELFLFHWTEIISQFKEDVLHTEKLQIMDLAKMEILMDRMLTQQQEQRETMERLRRDIAAERKKSPEDADLMKVSNMEKELSFAIAAQDDFGKQYREMMKEKKTTYKDMKATREQRVKRLEESKESIVGWMRKLIERPEIRRDIGIKMEKMRLATEVEMVRLADWHKYEDGKVDQPFLTPETVMDDNEVIEDKFPDIASKRIPDFEEGKTNEQEE